MGHQTSTWKDWLMAQEWASKLDIWIYGYMDGVFVGRIDGASDFNLEGLVDEAGVGGGMGEFVGDKDGDESFPPPQTQHA